MRRKTCGSATGEGAGTARATSVATSIALFMLAAVAEIGAASCLLGVAVIMYVPRNA